MTSSSTSTNAALRIGIVVLTIITALVHLSLNFPDPVFILNGLGYLTLLAALYLPVPQLESHRNLVRWVLVGFTALTIFLWILFGMRGPLGYADKAIEIVLILLLLLDARRSR
jgi:hypothetical protein